MRAGEKLAAALLVVAGLVGGRIAWQALPGRGEAAAPGLLATRANQSPEGRPSTASRAAILPQTGSAEAPAPEAPPVEIPRAAMARGEAVVHVASLLERAMIARRPVTTNADPGQLPPYTYGRDGVLAPGFGNLYGLSEGEVARLQARLTGVKQEMEDRFVAATTLNQPDENTVVLNVGSFERNGNAFADVFHEALGPERYRLFATLNGATFEDDGSVRGGPAAFFDHLVGDSTITVTRAPRSYRFAVEVPGPDGPRRLRSGGGIRAADVAAAVGPAAEVLPPGFLVDLDPNAAVQSGGVSMGGGGGGGGGGARTVQPANIAPSAK